MNSEHELSADPNRQLTNLRQVVHRSEAAIVALQKLVNVAQGKIRTLEGQIDIERRPERSLTPSRVHDSSTHGLKMFQ